MRPLWALPRRVSNLPRHRARDRIAARPDLPDDAVEARADDVRREAAEAHRPLPRLQNMRGGLSVRRAVRPHHRSRPLRGGANAAPDREALGREDRAAPAGRTSAAVARVRRDDPARPGRAPDVGGELGPPAATAARAVQAAGRWPDAGDRDATLPRRVPRRLRDADPVPAIA